MRDARDRMGKHITSAAQELRECQDSCLHTIQHCLRKGGLHADSRNIRQLLDTAELAGVATSFMIRSSDLHPRLCAVCAEACDACAASCEKVADDDEMQRCARLCRRAAESCRALAENR
jgi:hypothetical protein